ncbi:unnamed protein product [Ectocarpus sp. CCAP 1310/34]|nr:unnamed protein product [Ectocarpus sp. CCAP 1310/34]
MHTSRSRTFNLQGEALLAVLSDTRPSGSALTVDLPPELITFSDTAKVLELRCLGVSLSRCFDRQWSLKVVEVALPPSASSPSLAPQRLQTSTEPCRSLSSPVLRTIST